MIDLIACTALTIVIFLFDSIECHHKATPFDQPQSLRYQEIDLGTVEVSSTFGVVHNKHCGVIDTLRDRRFKK